MAFFKDGYLYRSDILDGAFFHKIHHGFATRGGGTSTLPHTASMNLAYGRGDDNAVVDENIRRFCDLVSGAPCRPAFVTQVHSDVIVKIKAGDDPAVLKDTPADGLITDVPGILLMVKVADCVPILLCGEKPDSVQTPSVIAALHCGWRGTAASLAAKGVAAMAEYGVRADSIRAAIGPCIRDCCYEVGEDFYAAFAESLGKDTASRFIKTRGGARFADLAGINRALLISAGIPAENIDVSDKCTCCFPDEFFSHRATRGIRGTGGVGIVIR